MPTEQEVKEAQRKARNKRAKKLDAATRKEMKRYRTIAGATLEVAREVER